MISISSAVQVILYLVVGGLIFWLLWYLVNNVGIPEPFKKVANVILLVLAVFVLIGILLTMLTGTPIFRP